MRANQLLDDLTDPIPDLDEYSGLSLKDIAAAVYYAPEDSEEQQRAIAAIRLRAPGIGHNRPPLVEAIDAELQPYRERIDELSELAAQAQIRGEGAEADDSAAKVNDLVVIIKDLETELDDKRLERNKPYRLGQKLINDSYGRITLRLAVARGGDTGKGGLIGMLTEHDDKRKAQAAALRQAALAEQAKREEEAREAQRRADEAALAGAGRATAQLDLLQAREAADRAADRAEAIRPAPLRSHLGTVSRRREVKSEIEDAMAFALWLYEQPTYRNHFLQALRTIAGQVTKAAGVDGVQKGLTIPGLKAWVETGAATIRR